MKEILVVSHCILNNASKVLQDESELADEYRERDELMQVVCKQRIYRFSKQNSANKRDKRDKNVKIAHSHPKTGAYAQSLLFEKVYPDFFCLRWPLIHRI